jgi:DNA-binding CsgD family transcriptional regulator
MRPNQHDPQTAAERRAEVVRLTRAGLTAEAIGVQLGCSYRTVVRDRKAMGVAQPAPMIVNAWSADDVAQAEAMIADGCSLTEVARTLGRSQPAVWQKFKGRGWDRSSCAQYRWMRQQMDKLDI